jgi:uncharacterized membrane protein YhaH (DUF805 family)
MEIPFTRYVSLRRPVGRTVFCLMQLICISLAEALVPDKVPKHLPAALLLSAAVFSLMGMIAARRLLDVGWSRLWAMLVVGPAALYAFMGGLWPRAGSVHVYLVSALLLGIVFVAYCAMTVLLAVRPAREVENGENRETVNLREKGTDAFPDK